MGYAKILALDLGKFKTVGCAMDAATKEHAFATLEPTREAPDPRFGNAILASKSRRKMASVGAR